MNTWTRTQLDWEVGFHADRHGTPASWVPAEVPGAVQLDWARAQNWPPYWQGNHAQDYAWMEDVYWTFRTTIPPELLRTPGRVFLVCRGIDYQFEVTLEGETVHVQEGMFTPFEVELTGRCQSGGELRITVHPAPKSVASPVDRTQANRSCKPAVSYGWDFHPRLIPLGIWDDTFIEVRPATYISTVELDYQLGDNLDAVSLTLTLSGANAADGRVRWLVRDPGGKTVLESEFGWEGDTFSARETIANPALWWPHDQGEPALYSTTLELSNAAGEILQMWERKIGFRKVALVMNEGAWLQPDGFPKSRSVPPITLEINGRRLFCKGSNWVSPQIFPGLLNREVYQPMLQLAKDANLSLLRCWGGAVVNKESFFDLCDELGIMVWQEFPLACNLYPDDPAYLRVLDQESKAIISRLKPHPSLVLWCGGNELFNAWSGMTDQSLPLRLLNRNCYDLDPGRPFIATAPLMGMGHGHYVFTDPRNGTEAFELFKRASNFRRGMGRLGKATMLLEPGCRRATCI
jgi:beta-mannosidase